MGKGILFMLFIKEQTFVSMDSTLEKNICQLSHQQTLLFTKICQKSCSPHPQLCAHLFPQRMIFKNRGVKTYNISCASPSTCMTRYCKQRENFPVTYVMRFGDVRLGLHDSHFTSGLTQEDPDLLLFLLV